MKKALNSFQYIIISFILLFSVYALIINFTVSKDINFDTSLILLANQFIHGHISLEPTTTMPIGDISLFSGKYYLYFGPFASLLLIPFALIFGSQFPQVFVGFFSIFFSFIAIYYICISSKFSKINAVWLSIFYVFSTVLLSSSIINISAFQVESLGSTLMLLSLYEYTHRRRPMIIGLLIGFATLTRVTLILSLAFFFMEYVQKRLKLNQIILLLTPVVICGAIFGIYNYVRFQSFFETGYKYNITLHSFPLSENLKYGYMSLTHIPANLYSFLFMSPLPVTMDLNGFVLKFPYIKVNPWGLAIWYTSPLFLVLLYKFRKGIYSISAGAATIFLAAPVFLYYSIGFAQFGYRYALDFLPFLFLLLLHSLDSKLSTKEKGMIVAGVLLNAFYMMSSWNNYPLLGLFQ